MSQTIKWPGSGSAISGSTPFGLYDTDSSFQNDGPRVATWCATRLGYNTIDVEMIDTHFYACFEEAVSEYGAQVNQFNIRNNLDILKGSNTGSNYTQKLVDGSFLPTVFRMSQAYGTLAGVGGQVDYKKAYVQLTSSVQIYDLMTTAVDSSTSSSFSTLYGTGSGQIDVMKVFFQTDPATTRYYDPSSYGYGNVTNFLSEFGFDDFSAAAQFVLMPIYEDILKMQHIEFNDTIRKSAFSFNIVNNKLEIFPVPTSTSPTKLWFEYMVRDEFENGASLVDGTVVSDYSNIGYNFIEYSKINDVGKQWIRKYTLALAKEVLGAIREKYNTIPVPDAEVSLDGAALRAEAQAEKEQLITELRENLEELSRKSQFENKANEADQHQNMLSKIPLKIYVG